MASSGEAWLIPGDQLFEPALRKKAANGVKSVFMAEDHGLCTRSRHHQQKLVLFLAAMRHHAAELEKAGFEVNYHELPSPPPGTPYFERLAIWCKGRRLKVLHVFEVSDRFFESELEAFCRAEGVELRRHPTPGFLTPRREFADYLTTTKRPFMKTFYERQRRRLSILMEKDGTPQGGRFSFDDENREALPDDVEIPGIDTISHDPVTANVIALVEKRFPDHPGKAAEHWLPSTRAGARRWLQRFIRERLRNFGPYEDALSSRDPVLFHSVLTPFLNTGLLTPAEVIEEVLEAGSRRRLPIASIEGFVRQVIGWREFIFGIDRHYGSRQWEANHWNHRRGITRHWYDATTGLPPLDDAIRKARDLAYCHHIERLMVLGTCMLTCEIHPHEAHRWFMEMFIDSAEWVMGPNVFGMGITSDGGIFATKPYLCGSNYWLKMGDYSKGDWCDVADGLYWGFIDRHMKEFVKNPRMATIARSLSRMKPDRREQIFRAAESFKKRVTTPGRSSGEPC
jgi:deoxyribodipyrimidine photolyase-related protein